MTFPYIHPAAWDEFEDTIRYLAQAAGADVALKFEGCVFHHLTEIQRAPLIYRIRNHDIRRVNLQPQFGEFFIAYIVWNAKVIVLAFGHAKRRPFYFRDRLDPAKSMF